jgi:8-oxo-dGTP diphosphatase
MFLVVVAALIVKKDCILVTQRKENDSYAGLWEFPGGTVEKGEELRNALAREIKEELNIKIKTGPLFDVQKVPGKNLLILFFLCKTFSKNPQAIDCLAWKWLPFQNLLQTDFCPADYKVAEKLIESGRGQICHAPNKRKIK